MSTITDVLENRSQWAIVQGDCMDVLRSMPDCSVNAVVTSPPYYGLREYGVPPSIWGGDKDCDHAWGGAINGSARGGSGTPTNKNGRGENYARSSPRGNVCDKCGAWHGCFGLEPTPSLYVKHAVMIGSEVRRVLRPDGLFWLNIGDSYANDTKRGGASGAKNYTSKGGGYSRERKKTGLKEKDLVGIPWMLARALQKAGWYLRSDCCWVKTSAMPESVKGWRWERHQVKVSNGSTGNGKADKASRRAAGLNDRMHAQTGFAQWIDCPGCKKCEKNGGLVLRRGSWRPTRAHEYVFMFAKSERYFADGEPVRTKLAEATVSRDKYSRMIDDPDEQFAVRHDHESVGNPAGANLRSWWADISPEPLREEHYAAFPSGLPARCIRASLSEKGYCPACGSPWVRILSRPQTAVPVDYNGKNAASDAQFSHRRILANVKARRLEGGEHDNPFPVSQTLGWKATCECGGEPIPGIVLDPFSGMATTLLAARRLGHRAIGIELSEKYARMAQRRVKKDSPLFN